MPTQVFGRGETIGKEYVVKKKIGEGQFSEVYEVEKASDGSRVGFGLDQCLQADFLFFDCLTELIEKPPEGFTDIYGLFFTAVCAQNRKE